MRKLFLITILLTSAKLFSQNNLSYRYKTPPQLKDGLQTASLSEVGIDSIKIITLTNKILTNAYDNIHSLLILKDNKLVYENYFDGQDQMIVFGADDKPLARSGAHDLLNNPIDSLHDARSISKSVVSACIGIAIAQGKIKNADQNIWTYFSEYGDLAAGMKSTITIRHLLTMTSGLDLNEKVPYYDSANTERQTNRSPDPIKFILSRQLINPPGTQWNYSGGCTELLAAIIHKVSGLEVDEFADKYLFKPLGITNFSWIRLPSTSAGRGAPAAASGLRLTSRELLKFGLLYLNSGKWKGKRIIPVDWISQSLQFHFTTNDPTTHYGYQFWGTNVKINNSGVEAFAAIGNGGQYIIIIPSLHVLIVVTAGNYGDNKLSQQSYEMVANELYPAIKIRTE
jgi:CubicO group peptidase (beta-lactamase class C family)